MGCECASLQKHWSGLTVEKEAERKDSTQEQILILKGVNPK